LTVDKVKENNTGVRGRIGTKTSSAGFQVAKKPFITRPTLNKPSPSTKPVMGVKAVKRLGFKQQPVTFTKTVNKTFNKQQQQLKPGAQLPTQPSFKKAFDARQKLSSAQGPTVILDARQKIMQKTKFADARQRIEMKKQVAQREGVTDMRMKILAKRRQSQGIAAPGTPGQPVQVTIPGRPATVPFQARMPLTATPVTRLMGQPSAAVVIGPGRFAMRPASVGTVMAVGGSLRKTIPANVSTTRLTVQAATSATQLTQLGKLQITARNEHVINRPAAAAALTTNKLRPAMNTQRDMSFTVTRPLETTLNLASRVARSASAAETAAARVAVQAAAASTSKPSDRNATAAAAQTALESEISPGSLQGFRVVISNLHESVSLDDIMELFGDIGPMKNARVVKPGVADVVFVNQHEAISAFKTYNRRELDGLPMSVELQFKPTAAATTLSTKVCPYIELDIDVMLRALFKSVADASPRCPTNFTVKL